MAAGGIHETPVTAGGSMDGTGLCWWDQRERLARGEPLSDPMCACLAGRLLGMRVRICFSFERAFVLACVRSC